MVYGLGFRVQGLGFRTGLKQLPTTEVAYTIVIDQSTARLLATLFAKALRKRSVHVIFHMLFHLILHPKP